MESIFTLTDFITIFILLIFVFMLVLAIKYINGDFSIISIEKIDEKEIEIKRENYITIKKIVTTYKNTYKDGRIKITQTITEL